MSVLGVHDAPMRCVGHRQITDLAAARLLEQATSQSLSTISGVVVRYAASGQRGQASLQYTSAGTLLAYRAPGDVAFGAGVNVGGGGAFTLVSANGKQLFVTVSAGSLPGSNQNDAIDVGIPEGAQSVMLEPSSQNVRVRGDGVAASATCGLVIPANAMLMWTGDMRVSAIETTGGALLDLAFFAG